MQKICRNCLKVNSGNRNFCFNCKSDNLGVYYSQRKRKADKNLGSNWRASHHVESPVDWGQKKTRSWSKSRKIWTGFLTSSSLIAAVLLSSFYFPDLWSQTKNVALSVAEDVGVSLDNDVTELGASQPQRLLPSVGYNDNGEYRFLTYDLDGMPTGFFSPCESIKYEVNPENEPEGAREQLELAIQNIQFHTGLKFEFVGETGESIPFDDEGQIAYRSNSLLIEYLPHQELNEKISDEYDHVDAAGWAGPVYEWLNYEKEQLIAVGAVMALDYESIEDDLAEGLFGEPRGQQTRSLMLHELGHAVGLDHVDSPFELMFTDIPDPSVSYFQKGDLEGLALAGKGPCDTDIFGNSSYGNEPAEYRNSALPSTCVVDSLIESHQMFYHEQESGYDYVSCRINPLNDPSGNRGVSVSYEATNLSADEYIQVKLESFNLDDSPDPLIENRQFGDSSCDVLAVYSFEDDPIPVYWLYVICDSVVTGVQGSNLNPARYFESATLGEIIEHGVSNLE